MTETDLTELVKFFHNILEQGRLRGAFDLVDLGNINKLLTHAKKEKATLTPELLTSLELALNKVSKCGLLTFEDGHAVCDKLKELVELQKNN
jgi:hypothetical protein